MDDEIDIDDENDWKAVDSDEDGKNDGDDDDDDNNNHDEEVERDDDVDIGFRSHQFQYGSHGRNRKRSRKQNQEEAIYGVFYESDNERNKNRNRDDGYEMNAAPLFVPATKKPEKSKEASSAPAPLFVAATKHDGAPMSVAASRQSKEPEAKESNSNTATAGTLSSTDPAPMFLSATKPSSSFPTKPSEEPPADENIIADEEEERIREEQQQADDNFLALLEQAKARNKRTRPRPGSSPGTTPTTPSAGTSGTQEATPTTNASTNDFAGFGGGGLGLGMPQGAGLPSSFGGGGGAGLGFSNRVDDEETGRKDPTVATWEKHTKGFGSKLLAKMGWKGSGGLGSNRRAFRGETKLSGTESTQEDPPDKIQNPNMGDSTNAPAPSAASQMGVKKGISRPVEVVVRPANMGLGFGNFKEASQLKANRRIEAEVRGIDYDAQLAKEKEAARQKRRKQRKDRYGTHYASSTDDDGDENDDATDKPSSGSRVQSSAIPTTEDLLSNRSWKATRSRSTKSKKRKRTVHDIIPYQELIDRQKRKSGGGGDQPMVIIDMRGPSEANKSKESSRANNSVVPLGEELLYNLSFLLGTYENKLHSSSRHHETTIQRTITSLDHKIRDAEDRSKKSKERRTKLARAHAVAETVKTAISDSNDANGNEYVKAATTKQKVNDLVVELRDVFTPEERKDLHFWNVLAPTLLGPVLEQTLATWKPLVAEGNGLSKKRTDRAVVDSFFEWAPSGESNNSTSNANGKNSDNGDGRILCESMVRNQLVPKLKADIESQASPVWDPVTNPYAVLDLYEYLRAKALAFDQNGNNRLPKNLASETNEDDPNQIFPSSRDDEDEDFGNESKRSSHLAEYIHHELILDALYPKLQLAISHWKPTRSSKSSEILYPLHRWVLPWLPHIDHPVFLPNLLGECRRKLKLTLSLLQRGIQSASNSSGKNNNDGDYAVVASAIGLLRPWSAILDWKSLQKMVSEHRTILPKLERLLVSEGTSVATKEDPSSDWMGLNVLFEFHQRHLLSPLDFLSLLEGPFLSTWARGIHSLLCVRDDISNSHQPALGAAVNRYQDCKSKVLVGPLSDRNKLPSPSLELVRGDSHLCRMFYSVVRMIEIRHQLSSFPSSDAKQLWEELDRLEPDAQTFYTVRGRRFLEENEKVRDAGMASRSMGESRARAVLREHRNIPEPTFREVVETFAGEKGVVFRPKPGARVDGKPVYLFGDRSIYLEGDVVFCHDGKNSSENDPWRPVSLDRLGAIAWG